MKNKKILPIALDGEIVDFNTKKVIDYLDRFRYVDYPEGIFDNKKRKYYFEEDMEEITSILNKYDRENSMLKNKVIMNDRK